MWWRCEAPVVANVDSSRVSYVGGRLGDVLWAEGGVDEGEGIGRLCEVELGLVAGGAIQGLRRWLPKILFSCRRSSLLIFLYPS